MASAKPIRKSSLPATPPSEYEFHTVHGGQPDSPGILLIPNDDSGPVVVRRRVTYGDWEPVHPNHWADEAKATGGVHLGSALKDVGAGDVCRPVEVDGETIRVRGQGELSTEAEEALAALVRAAKTKFIADAPERVGALQNRLRLAHQARRAKEHQLDDIRRALCDVGFMEDDDPYSHADLADVIRQVGEIDENAAGVANEKSIDLARWAARLEETLREVLGLFHPVYGTDLEQPASWHADTPVAPHDYGRWEALLSKPLDSDEDGA